MSQFSTNETVSLEKQLDLDSTPTHTPPELVDSVYEIPRCVSWIKSNNFEKICLQFPDHLLPDSSEVALRLQKQLGVNVYILADTVYESCCIDHVAAKHASADALIHFGPICFSKTSSDIPYLSIYEKKTLDLDKFSNSLSQLLAKHVTILLDSPYICTRDDLKGKLSGTRIEGVDSDNLDLEHHTVIFIVDRKRSRMLHNLKFSFRPDTLYSYNDDDGLQLYEVDNKTLRKRYYLVERIKDSNTVGIVIGTLGVKNYLQVIDRMKKLLTLHRKKYYLLSVGKPNVAKLANFPELDIFVMISCAMSDIFDSRDYYKPIVTPFDVEIALNPASENLSFSYDYNKFVSDPISENVGTEGDVSLVSGKIRGLGDSVTSNEINNELALKRDGAVALSGNHGAGFLAARTWKGLEQDLGKTDVKIAEEGRRGIAQTYTNETSDLI